MSRRELTLRVAGCPWCGAEHGYVIEVTLRSIASAPAATERTQVVVACAVDGRSFLMNVDIPVVAGQQFEAAQFARLAA